MGSFIGSRFDQPQNAGSLKGGTRDTGKSRIDHRDKGQVMANASERYDLITRRLQEVLGGDSIKAILEEGKRSPKCYWGK
jgi:hypothetical protein